MERRTFLKNTGLLTGGLLLNQNLSAIQPGADPVKIAVVGCGDRGTGIMNILNGMPDQFRITGLLPYAMCSISG